MKNRIEIREGRAVFFGPMTCEAIRSRVEAFEALTGSYPLIKIAAPTVSRRAVMTGLPVSFQEPRRVVVIQRLFVRLDMTGGRTLDLVPEQVPDLIVEYHLAR